MQIAFYMQVCPSSYYDPSDEDCKSLFLHSHLHCLSPALFQLYLTTYCEGLTFFWVLTTGYQMKPVMKNPLGGAKSPSDFWGRRWNLLVQSVLKGGVYEPFQKYGYSPMTAVVTTFLASGLFHEWLVDGLFSTACQDPNAAVSSCYHPMQGGE
jgi:hypothetical protein